MAAPSGALEKLSDYQRKQRARRNLGAPELLLHSLLEEQVLHLVLEPPYEMLAYL